MGNTSTFSPVNRSKSSENEHISSVHVLVKASGKNASNTSLSLRKAESVTVPPEVDGSEKSGAVQPDFAMAGASSAMKNSDKSGRGYNEEVYLAYLTRHSRVKGLARGTGGGIVERTDGPRSRAQ